MSRRFSEKSGKKADGAAAESGVPADSGCPFPANTGNSFFSAEVCAVKGVHILRPGENDVSAGTIRKWCATRDSNPQTFRCWDLNPVRLPISPVAPEEAGYNIS